MRRAGCWGGRSKPVVVDPASNWDLFAEKAKQLLLQDKVAVVFGCWTSVSRKSVLPVFEKNNGLLFYPVQYEGEECSRNVFYTGAAVNQQAVPAVEYLMSKEGGGLQEVLSPRDRLRVSPHDEQDSAGDVVGEESAGGQHHGRIHAVPPSGLSNHLRQD